MPATILAGLAHEDGELHFVTESQGGRRLTADLRFEEPHVEWIGSSSTWNSIGAACQASTSCSSSDRSSKYVRKDRIFPSRKSATVKPASWTRRPVASSTASSLRT